MVQHLPRQGVQAHGRVGTRRTVEPPQHLHADRAAVQRGVDLDDAVHRWLVQTQQVDAADRDHAGPDADPGRAHDGSALRPKV